MSNRWRDWLKEATNDLEIAKTLRDDGRHSWACFACHHAGEKAVKALVQYHHREAWGHSIREILEEANELVEVPKELIEIARSLDVFYIPTRYPDAHPSGSPSEHYGPLQSEEALKHARAIVEFANREMA